MRSAKLLSQREVGAVHEDSLEILEKTGVLVRNEKARRIFKKHGCHVNSETAIVKIPGDIVEEYQKAFIPTFTFKGREPDFDKSIPHDSPVMVTGSSAPNIADPVTGETRLATSFDIANIALLINNLEGFDVFSVSTLACDAPKGRHSISRFYPALKNCLKPVRGNTADMDDLMQVLEMGTIIAGSKDAYYERPLITHHCCPMVSPLTMDINSTDVFMYLTEEELPVYGTIVPNAGMTAPMSLFGTLTLGNAEFLAMSVLKQMIKPNSPTIYAALSTVADMLKGNYAPGAIETGILQMAHSQMANFYGVPSGGYIGLTNSHKNDAQAGYETGMNTTAALLGGLDMFNGGGLLSSLMTFDFGKAVIDNDIFLMLKKLKEGIPFGEEDICLDVISKTGPGGNYLECDYTLQHMKDVAVAQRVSTHEMRGEWEKSGSLDTHARALKEAEKILKWETPPIFIPETDNRIRQRFDDLVAGDAKWEENGKKETGRKLVGGFI